MVARPEVVLIVLYVLRVLIKRLGRRLPVHLVQPVTTQIPLATPCVLDVLEGVTQALVHLVAPCVLQEPLRR